MNEIRLTSKAARRLKNELEQIDKQFNGDKPMKLKYVSIRAGDPSGSPEGCSEFDIGIATDDYTSQEGKPSDAA